MSASTLAFESRHGHATIEISQEAIRVSSRGHHELDPKWTTTDPAGHVHSSYETVEWVVTSTYWCDQCRDEHDEGEYRCLICAAVVEPLYRWTGPYSVTVPGLREGWLRLSDGRAWLLRGDELEVPFVGGHPAEEWVSGVVAREPDEWTVMVG